MLPQLGKNRDGLLKRNLWTYRRKKKIYYKHCLGNERPGKNLDHMSMALIVRPQVKNWKNMTGFSMWVRVISMTWREQRLEWIDRSGILLVTCSNIHDVVQKLPLWNSFSGKSQKCYSNIVKFLFFFMLSQNSVFFFNSASLLSPSSVLTGHVDEGMNINRPSWNNMRPFMTY